jgi:hypothetical protein
LIESKVDCKRRARSTVSWLLPDLQIELLMDRAYSSETNIYEHGILVGGDEHPKSLSLIATAKLPIYSGFSLAIVDSQGRSLNEPAAHLAEVNGPHYQADYYEEYDLRYCVLAALYHMNRLIDLYVTITQLFERQHPIGTAVSGNIGDPRVFYEIDAFLGAARRVYESIIKVLWKHYYPRTAGRWRSIRSAVNSLDKIPPLFATELKQSWNAFGEKLADYRDCVTHYVPLTDGNTTCWMERYGTRWGMTVKLPANPSKKSRTAFDFNSGPDALGYCHSVVTHLVKLCEILKAQTKVASYLANPRKG